MLTKSHPLWIAVMICASACTIIPADEGVTMSNTSSDAKPESSDTTLDKGLNWLEYADAKADANLALARGDTRLLAFASRMIKLPGVEAKQYQDLREQCGYRVLSGTGDAVKIGEDTSLRSKLHEYASTYNQVIQHACKSNSNS